MATSSAINNEPVTSGAKVDMRFEVVVIPVGDVDRSKSFYTKLGWRLDADFPFDNGFRVVQFTPPGSGCSVQFGGQAPHRRDPLTAMKRFDAIIIGTGQAMPS
jgi:catechol 2,3-dioxygenase-like lactoylglutathione lyase family enzyme